MNTAFSFLSLFLSTVYQRRLKFQFELSSQQEQFDKAPTTHTCEASTAVSIETETASLKTKSVIFKLKLNVQSSK